MRQAEKALRDAGWEEVMRSSVSVGEEIYSLDTGQLYVTAVEWNAPFPGDTLVLRAPRPEPEYAPGTVARVRSRVAGYECNAIYSDGCWHVDGVDSFTPGEVEVVRVIAYPDGTTPQDDQSMDALIEGMVPRVAEWGYDEMRVAKFQTRGVKLPKWPELHEVPQEIWKVAARHVLRAAYEEASRGDD